MNDGRRANPCHCATPIRPNPYCGDKGLEDDE